MQYTHWAIVVIILGVGVYLIYQWKNLMPSARRMLMGVMLALSLFYMVPVTAVNMNRMTKVDFCLQCHTMEPWGKSLKVNDEESIAAVHYQNALVPSEKACYTCHTDYSLFGPIKAKISGLKHLWVFYTTGTPKEVKLYKPFDAKNCLHCHNGGKRFVEVARHTGDGVLPKILSGEMGCTVSGCHDIAHVKDFEGAEFVADEFLPGAGAK